MKTKALSTLLVLAFATGSVAQAGIKEIIGRVTGGVLGGALCNELGIGKGNGRTVAIALCAVGGSMIGGEIGRDMDEADAQAFEESQRRSFDGDLNRDYDWDGGAYGSRTGIHGRLRPINEGYHYRTHEVCREYQSVTYRGNRSSQTRSIVCRRGDGSFYSLEERSLFVNGRLVERETNEREGGGRRRGPPPPYVTPSPERRPVPPPVYYDRCANWDARELRYGDVVYTRYGQTATYLGTNRSGREVSVEVRGFNQILRLEDIAIQGCHLGVSTGREVSTRYGQQGLLGGVFSNGDVAVLVRGYVQVLRRDDIYY